MPEQKLTKRQAAIIGAYTGILCGGFDEMQIFIEEIMERPVMSHELGSGPVTDEVKRRAKPYFLEICNDE